MIVFYFTKETDLDISILKTYKILQISQIKDIMRHELTIQESFQYYIPEVRIQGNNGKMILTCSCLSRLKWGNFYLTIFYQFLCRKMFSNELVVNKTSHFKVSLIAKFHTGVKDTMAHHGNHNFHLHKRSCIYCLTQKFRRQRLPG